VYCVYTLPRRVLLYTSEKSVITHLRKVCLSNDNKVGGRREEEGVEGDVGVMC
jgi:hypothetical protein